MTIEPSKGTGGPYKQTRKVQEANPEKNKYYVTPCFSSDPRVAKTGAEIKSAYDVYHNETNVSN